MQDREGRRVDLIPKTIGVWLFGPAPLQTINELEENERMNEFKFDVGSTVKDTITGFEGVVMARIQWLNNCNTYRVQPRDLDKDGKVQDVQHFDEPQLALVKTKAIKNHPFTGGPDRGSHRTNR